MPTQQSMLIHTNTVLKKARQHLFPLRRLNWFDMGPQILKKFYNCTTESILTGCLAAWYGNCLASACKELQRVVCKEPVHHLGRAPCHPGLFYQAVSEEGPKIDKDSSHQSHRPLSLLLHSKWYQCTGTNRTLNSFYPPLYSYLYVYTVSTSYLCTSNQYWYPVYIAKLLLLIVYLFNIIIFFYIFSLCIIGKGP